MEKSYSPQKYRRSARIRKSNKAKIMIARLLKITKSIRKYIITSTLKHPKFSAMSSVTWTTFRRIGRSLYFQENNSKRPRTLSTRKLSLSNQYSRAARIFQLSDTDNHVKTRMLDQIYSMAVVLAILSQTINFITRSIPQRAMISSFSKLRSVTSRKFKDCTNVGAK